MQSGCPIFYYCLSFLVLGLGGCEDSVSRLEQQKAATRQALQKLDNAPVGQTAPEIGLLYADKANLNSSMEWVQVDLGESTAINQIALLPVQTEWDSKSSSSRLFPKRFKLEVSDDPGFSKSTVVAKYHTTDFPDPLLEPVVFTPGNCKGQFIRLSVESPSIFALAEMMVISGNRNIALGCKVSCSQTPPIIKMRWAPDYLVDGRTPLGPPVIREEQIHHGLYAGPTADKSPAWMMVNLGSVFDIQEVRLYPIHNRQSIEMPGYGFPGKFRLECSNEPTFENPVVLYTSETESSNPGTNVVTIRIGDVRAQYIRVVLLEGGGYIDFHRFGLSEMEVYSNDRNVAYQTEVVTVGDPAEKSRDWPTSLLVDGRASEGRIIELPAWLERWDKRKQMRNECRRLDAELETAHVRRRKMTRWMVSCSAILVIGGIGAIAWHSRRVRQKELEAFRRKLAQDLHDEVGSNLAAIGMISDTAAKLPVPPGADCWDKVNQIARKTTDAMRETLWLAGGGVEMRASLIAHLQSAAVRLLPGRKVVWAACVEKLPEAWEAKAGRDVCLFFKEAIANVLRHSQAETVVFSAQLKNDEFELKIQDDGKGFTVTEARMGIGLASLRERAARIGGSCEINTKHESGTAVILRVKIKS